jgi:cytoskeletal protein CcmA (bactofilin family)
MMRARHFHFTAPKKKSLAFFLLSSLSMPEGRIEMWSKLWQEEVTVAAIAEGNSSHLAMAPSKNEESIAQVSSIPMVETAPNLPVIAASLGKTVKFVGQIFSEEDIFVHGDLEGTIEATKHKLTIGASGVVHASVKAHDVVVFGTLEGDVEVGNRIEIGSNAKVIGDIRTARIHIEDGAHFNGSIDIVMPDAANAADELPSSSGILRKKGSRPSL